MRTVAALLLMACGAQTAPRPAAGHLEVVPMRIVVAGAEGPGSEAMVIRADGGVEAEGKAIGTIHRDGRFVAADGKEVGRLQADGRISGGSMPELGGLTIDPDGIVKKDGQPVMTLGTDGVMSPVGGETKIRLVGPAAGRRAAVFVFLIASLPAAQ